MQIPSCCPRCGSTHLQRIGHKKTATGIWQQWRCADNKHRFTGHEKYSRATVSEQQLALTLASEGLGIRAIARTVGRFPNSVVKWLQKGESVI